MALKRTVKTETQPTDEKATKSSTKPPKAPKVGSRPAGKDSVIIKTEMVDLSLLSVYYKNPRIGNVDEIAKSLHLNKQFKPIVVNVGTKTGRKYEVLAGNHTLMAAKKELEWQEGGRFFKKEPWTKLYAAFVDVTEDEAKKIVLADNKIADYGGFDDKLLAQLFAELPDTIGTGYHSDEIDKIVASLPSEKDTGEVFKSLDEFKAAMPAPVAYPERDNWVGGSERPGGENGPVNVYDGEDEDDEDYGTDTDVDLDDIDEEEDLEIDDASVQLQAVYSLREATVPLTEGEWGIPTLREDYLLRKEDIVGLRTWADNQLTPDDGKSTWFVNHSSGARKGLPYERSILAFYGEDVTFDKWFDEPAWNLTKFSLLGINKAVIPDYSLYGDAARAVHLYNVFKAMWLGRYMQDCGWRVAPRLQFAADDPDTLDIALQGHPVGAPVLVCGLQTWGGVTDEHNDRWKILASEAINRLDPEVLVAYVGPPGKKIMEGVNFKNWKGEVRYIDTVSTIRNKAREAVVKKTQNRKLALKKAKEKAKAEAEASSSNRE